MYVSVGVSVCKCVCVCVYVYELSLIILIIFSSERFFIFSQVSVSSSCRNGEDFFVD